MKKTRSDKGKTHKKKRWTFKVAIKKQITNLKNTIKGIGKNYYKQEVDRLKDVNPDWNSKRIREEARKRQSGYERIMTQKYDELNQFLLELKDQQFDTETARYISQFVNMDLGKGGFSISNTDNFNMLLLKKFAEKAGGYDKIQTVTLGLSPEELESFKYFIEDRDDTDFFYEYLENVDNSTLVQDIMEFMNHMNISNEIVGRLEL